MWRTKAATISSPSNDSAFALGSIRCSNPSWAATSSLNIAWRITFESDLHVVGAKASYAHPFALAGRVYPGDPPNDPGIDPTYYRETERHRDVAHVFVLGGDVEPHVRALLRRTGYRRIVSGGLAGRSSAGGI